MQGLGLVGPNTKELQTLPHCGSSCKFCHGALVWPHGINREPTRGPGGPKAIFGKWGNPYTMISWWGSWGNGLAQRPLGCHTIQSPRTDPLQPPWGTISSTKSGFRGSFLPKKAPWSCRNPTRHPELQNWPPRSEILKLHTEQSYRIQWSVFQTEPYVASCGLKPF